MENESEVLDALPVTVSAPHSIPVVVSSYAATPAMRVSDAVDRFQALTEFVKKIMRPDIDFGVIPGTGTKPTLLKPGAEKLCTFFGLRTEFIEMRAIEDFDKGLFFYVYKCKLWRGDACVGEGNGSCNSFEKKYRYRNAERVCPACGKAAIIRGKAEFGGGWLCWKKKDGCGEKFAENDPAITSQDGGQVQNPDTADCINTIQKMGQKRALVAATLVAVNASEFFTQDIEDMAPEHAESAPPPRQPAPQSAPIQQPQRRSETAQAQPSPAPPSAPTQAEIDAHPAEDGWNYSKIISSGPPKAGSKSKGWVKFSDQWGEAIASTFHETVAKSLLALKPGQVVWMRLSKNGNYFNVEEI